MGLRRAGDATDAEFTEFVRDHGAALRRTASLLTGDRSRGEDLTQTALARAYAHRAKVRRADDPPAYVRRLLVDGPYTCAYLLSVGFVAEDTPPEQLQWHRGQGRLCPRVDLPAVDPRAVLVRCTTPTGLELALTLPDARGAGTWVLDAQARTDAEHPATDALTALVDGVVGAYG